MTELARPKQLSLSRENKGIIEEAIIETAKSGPPFLDVKVNPAMMKTVSETVDLMLDLQKKTAEAHHPQIHEDTDIVWEITGPGHFSTKFPDKDDRYKDLEWTRKMDRRRLRTSFAITRAVTAMRLNMPVAKVTDQDLIQNGPFLVYTGTPAEGEHLREVYEIHRQNYKLTPPEKLIILDKVIVPCGSLRDSYDTVDGVESFELPNDISPRRIVIVSHVQHLARVLYIMERYKDKIPEKTVLQAYPVTAPKRGEFEYAVMEARGILAGIYKTGKLATKPYPYQT